MELDQFWVSVKYMENLQILSRQLFAEKSYDTDKIVLKDYITYDYGAQSCKEILNNN